MKFSEEEEEVLWRRRGSILKKKKRRYSEEEEGDLWRRRGSTLMKKRKYSEEEEEVLWRRRGGTMKMKRKYSEEEEEVLWRRKGTTLKNKRRYSEEVLWRSTPWKLMCSKGKKVFQRKRCEVFWWRRGIQRRRWSIPKMMKKTRCSTEAGETSVPLRSRHFTNCLSSSRSFPFMYMKSLNLRSWSMILTSSFISALCCCRSLSAFSFRRIIFAWASSLRHSPWSSFTMCGIYSIYRIIEFTACNGNWKCFTIYTDWLISMYTDLFLYAEYQWICKVSLYHLKKVWPPGLL